MSVKIMTMVFEADERLKATQKLVMLALADHAADDGTSVYPSIKTISYKTGLKESAIRKALKELRDDVKIIRITRHFTSRRPNQYAINLTRLSSFKRVLLDDTQESGVSRGDTQGITKKPSRVSPRDTDPSITINEPPIHAVEKKPRERDLLFDAIAEVCQVDPATIGSSIGTVKTALLKANPPYTPEEVRAFGEQWWSWKERTGPPTIWQLRERIGNVRQTRKPTKEDSIGLVFS